MKRDVFSVAELVREQSGFGAKGLGGFVVVLGVSDFGRVDSPEANAGGGAWRIGGDDVESVAVEDVGDAECFAFVLPKVVVASGEDGAVEPGDEDEEERGGEEDEFTPHASACEELRGFEAGLGHGVK